MCGGERVRRGLLSTLILLLIPALCLHARAGESKPPKLDPAKPLRGIAFLSSSIGSDIKAEEMETFCGECGVGFVVIDFAWITHHFDRTDFTAVEKVLSKLKASGVVVGAMYRPRSLLEKDAQVHFARQADGSLPKSHLHLCFAHADSVDWGAAWGEKILKALPSVDHMILYNVAAFCHCEACASGAGAGHADAFVKTCRERWTKIRPTVKVGHVGGRLEYGDHLDFFCPFLSVLRKDDKTPVNTDALAAQMKGIAAQAKGKAVVPLAKICWSSETKNATEDVIGAFTSCRRRGLGCLLWYYGWVFHSDQRRYDPKSIVEALGGKWEALAPFLQDDGEEKAPPAAGPANANAWIFFHSKESRDGEAPRLVLQGRAGGPVELRAVKDACLISYLPDRAGGIFPQLSIQLSDANRALVAFPSPVKWSGGALRKAELVLDLGLPKLAVEKPFELALHVVKEAWSEDDIRWKNQPAFNEKPDLVVEVKPEKGIVRFDVTGIAAGWFVRRVPNHGLLLKVARPAKAAPAAVPPAKRDEGLLGRLAAALPWEKDAKEALKKAADSKRLVLALVGAEHEDKPVQLMQAFVFTDPAVLELVKARFVPLRLDYGATRYAIAKTAGRTDPKDPLLPLGTNMTECKAPALCVSKPGGELVARMESIGSFDPVLVYRFLLQALEKAGALSKAGGKDAEALLASGDLKRAETLFKKARSPEKEWGLARVESRRGRFEEALDLARTLKRKGGGTGADGRVMEGVCLLRLGRYEEAVGALDGALRAEPSPEQFARALHFHGALAFRRKYPDAAKASWERLRREYPQSPWSMRAGACLTWTEWIGYETLQAIPATPEPITGTERPVPPAQEDALVERALAYLIESREKDGSWPHLDAPYWRAPVTALCALTLFTWSGSVKTPRKKEIDEAISSARAWILGFMKSADPDSADSFGAAYILEFLLADHARKGGASRQDVERAIALLFGGQCPGGAWSYNRHFGVSWKGGFSGWPKTDKGRVHSMNTGLALLALADAKKAGFDVDAEALARGVEAMKAMRDGPGVFTYTHPVPRNFNKAELNLGRGPLCEQALLLLGASDATDLRKAVDTFMRLRQDLRIPVKLTAGWIPPNAASNYFFFFAYYHAARAIVALGPEDARKKLPLLRADLLAVPEMDSTWVDSHGAGKPYGTAMALLVLKMARDAAGK